MDPVGEKLDAEGGKDGKQGSPDQGVEAQEKSQPDSSEGGMGDSSADEYNPP